MYLSKGMTQIHLTSEHVVYFLAVVIHQHVSIPWTRLRGVDTIIFSYLKQKTTFEMFRKF